MQGSEFQICYFNITVRGYGSASKSSGSGKFLAVLQGTTRFIILSVVAVLRFIYCNKSVVSPAGYKDTCRHLKKLTCKRTLLQVFIFLRPPPLLGFYLRWSSNFVDSESGKIQSIKLLQNTVSNTTPYLPPPHPQYLHTVFVRNIALIHTGKGERIVA